MIRRLEQIYALAIVVIFVGLVFHAPLTVYMGTIFPDSALLIKSWKELMMLALMPLAIYLVTYRRLWGEFGRDWIFRLLIAYAVLHLVLVGLFFTGAQSTMAGLAIDLRYVLFFAFVYTLLRIAPGYRDRIIQVAVAGAIVVLGFATVQVFLPADVLSHIGYGNNTIQPYMTVDKNPDYIRHNSTLRGPNPLGAYAAASLILIAAFVVRMAGDLRKATVRWGLVALIIAGSVALWVSYSRSSVLALLIGLAVIVSSIGVKKLSRKTLGIAAAIVGVVAVVGFVAAQQTHFVSNVILHENPEGGSSVSSNDGHAESLVVGTERLVREPLGNGVGSTGSASLLGDHSIIIENQYLFIGHETGWIGLGLYIGIVGLLMWRLWKRRSSWLGLGMFASGLGLAFVGLIQPVWVDDTVSMVWWGLAAVAVIGDKKHDRSTTKQKTA